VKTGNMDLIRMGERGEYAYKTGLIVFSNSRITIKWKNVDSLSRKIYTGN